jgi:hypothetical protein
MLRKAFIRHLVSITVDSEREMLLMPPESGASRDKRVRFRCTNKDIVKDSMQKTGKY